MIPSFCQSLQSVMNCSDSNTVLSQFTDTKNGPNAPLHPLCVGVWVPAATCYLHLCLCVRHQLQVTGDVKIMYL